MRMTPKASPTLAGIAVLVAALSSTLLAQWPNHPDPSVPRSRTGEPDLDGPVPRMPDGKPDLSGLWQGQNAFPGRGADATTPPPDAPPPAGFRDVGQNIKGGLPFTPLGQELLKKRVADNSKDNPEAWCLPMGIMQFHTQGAPRKFVQTAEAAGDPLRGELRHPADLHGRPQVTPTGRSATVVLRLLDGTVGGRHAGGRHHAHARRRLARHHRLATHRRRDAHRAHSPRRATDAWRST